MKICELWGLILATLLVGIILGAYLLRAIERWKGPGLDPGERGEPTIQRSRHVYTRPDPTTEPPTNREVENE